MWAEYIEQRKKQRQKEEEELKKLKERQVSPSIPIYPKMAQDIRLSAVAQLIGCPPCMGVAGVQIPASET